MWWGTAQSPGVEVARRLAASTTTRREEEFDFHAPQRESGDGTATFGGSRQLPRMPRNGR